MRPSIRTLLTFALLFSACANALRAVDSPPPPTLGLVNPKGLADGPENAEHMGLACKRDACERIQPKRNAYYQRVFSLDQLADCFAIRQDPILAE